MTDVRDQGLQVLRELLPGLLPDGEVQVPAPGFGGEMFGLALDNVFGRLWTRDSLSRRDRSLVTLGALIALRVEGELQAHFRIARNNGLSDDEIAEVIYHCTAYAGFPAANSAMEVAKQVLGAESNRAT